MAKTIIVGGYGPGISSAVAEKFGSAGFNVALAARSAERLAAGVKALEGKGIKAAAFPTDLADEAAVRALVGKVRDKLGPISVVQWTAYGSGGGDLLTAKGAEIHQALDVAVTGLLAAIQESLPDLRSQPNAAILVTNGGLGLFNDQVDAMGAQYNLMGLSLANSAKHKLVRLLSHKLKADNIYVGEVMVLSSVKGTPFDSGNATLEAATVADKFWQIYTARTDVTVQVS